MKPTVLVTGGSRGIGRAIVEKFKDHGWQVATCATDLQHLKDNPADFKFKCDVATLPEVKKGIEEVVQNFGKIDALINNAGLAGTNDLSPQASDEFWHKIIDVNLHGTYYFSKYAAPYLPDHTGRIVNIASVLGLKGVPDQTAYCAAKHAVIGFTKSYAHFLAPRKISVNVVCPGWTRTDMAKGRLKEIGIAEADLKNMVPLGRFVEPQEVADLVYYLASSQASSMITGQTFTIDGGVLA
jgi:NAD(P)-dependent dehydrogenase (short-subunit alcohol dehydrogenase family)